MWKRGGGEWRATKQRAKPHTASPLEEPDVVRALRTTGMVQLETRHSSGFAVCAAGAGPKAARIPSAQRASTGWFNGDFDYNGVAGVAAGDVGGK